MEEHCSRRRHDVQVSNSGESRKGLFYKSYSRAFTSTRVAALPMSGLGKVRERSALERSDE